MGSCILDLYRSATPNPFAHWGPWSPVAEPGLVLHATGDPFSDATAAKEVAGMLGARFATIEGAGHFVWMDVGGCLRDPLDALARRAIA